MKLFVLCALFLVACTPSEYGTQLVADSGAGSALTGNVIADAFEQYCSDDNSCGPGQVCQNSTCVPKSSVS